MKLTILGSGTCHTDPKRFPPGFLLNFGREDKILFECSEGIKWRLQEAGYEFGAINHIAISHSHPDHCAPVHFIQTVLCKLQASGKNPADYLINFYCPAQIQADFSNAWKFYLPGNKERAQIPWPKLNFHSMTANGSKVEMGTAILESKPTYHAFGESDSLAFRLSCLEGIFSYSGDTGQCDAIFDAAKEADIFLCEASAKIGD